MKKIVTTTGTTYLLDEDAARVKRLPTEEETNLFGFEGEWVGGFSITEPVVGERWRFAYGYHPLSTSAVVSVEDVGDEQPQ